ncbi:sensor domain-containing diguanylate cyclase [Maridesulfovibrio frigidus]|uniref:sensor domain-containing diguanylate cyclase n=1 Tax=Maridesulfovibrio frigidus TaxID=340956 RepID=UPI0004E12C0D|nr:diguanylate cyclase [Maridesulfovibrio frigidus]
MNSKKKRNLIKLFVKSYLPVAVLILSVSIWVIYTQKRQYVDLVSNHEMNLAKGDCVALSAWVSTGVQDVGVVAGLVENSLRKGRDLRHQLDHIADMFSVFGREREICLQLRYISLQGKELVRINMKGNEPERIIGESLQNKGDRSYIKNALELKSGVYVSSFDLNREHGKVEIPYVPVLRFLKKVYGADGEALGLVAINYSGEALIRMLNDSSKESFGDVFFVNSQGGWIIGPDSNYDWRFLFGDQDSLMKDQFPLAWENILAKPIGQFFSPNGLFTSQAICEDSSSVLFGSDVTFHEKWKIITNVSHKKLRVPQSAGNLFLILILFGWTGFLFWRRTVSSLESERVTEALKESDKRFMDITDAAGEFIWETGPDGSFVFVTGRAEDVLGYSAEELVGRSPFDFVDEESSWEVRKEFLDAAQEGKSFRALEFKFVNRDGRRLWLEFNGIPVLDSEGNVTGFRGATSDVTMQKKALQDLQDREDMLQSISDSVQDALILMDDKGLVHFWNPAAEIIFGFSSEEMLGKDLRSCVWLEDNVDDPVELHEEGEDLKSLFNSYGSFTVNVRRKDGSVFPAEVLLSPLKRDEMWWVVGTIRDVTERKEAEDALRKLATTDPLTGLSNRRFFMERSEEEVEKALRYKRSLSLLMVDIDFFKNVNDTYGHDAGDDVLKALSAVGLKVLRNVDVFGRIGGEEFSILLPDTTLAGAELVAERLRGEIEATSMKTRSGDLSITVSVGVTTFSENLCTLEHLLKAADLGLYAAKDAGRNQVKVQLAVAEEC